MAPKRLVLPICVAFCILLFSCPLHMVNASGQKLYIVPNPAAKDKADCSKSSPCSLKHGLEIAGPNAQLEFSAGKYEGPVVIQANQTGLSLNGAGAAQTVIECAFNESHILVDIHATKVSANRIGFVHSKSESATGHAHIGVLFRDTATGGKLDEVLVLFNSSSKTSVSRGVVVDGASEVKLKKTMVVGPWQDGIHLITSSSKVKQGLVEGATRIGIAVINTNTTASSENKIKQVVVRNIGDKRTFGTAIEIQGNNNHVKEGEISNWGKYGIHVCGEIESSGKCDPCHYSKAVEELPKESPLKTAVHNSIKGVTFWGRVR